MTTIGRCAIVLVWVCLVAPLRAQEAPPVLTELEKARVQIVSLLDLLRKSMFDADSCRAALAEPRNTANTQQVATARQQLTADIERDHPGYTWNAQTGALVKKDPAK